MKEETVKRVHIHFKYGYPQALEVTDDAAAACEAAARGGYSFRVQTLKKTFESVATPEGAQDELVGMEILDETPRRFIADKVYTAAEVAADIRQALEIFKDTTHPVQAAGLRGKIDALEKITEIEKEYSFSLPCVRHPFYTANSTEIIGNRDVIWLREGEKVYDRNARQIWPKPAP